MDPETDTVCPLNEHNRALVLENREANEGWRHEPHSASPA